VLPGLILNASVPDVPAEQMPPAGAWIAIALVAILISMVGQLAVIRLATGHGVTVGEALRHGAARFLSYFAAALMWVLPLLLVMALLYEPIARDPEHPSGAAALGFVIVFLAGLYLSVRLVLLPAVASAEASGPVRILKDAWQVTAGNWWRLFGFLVMYAVGASALLLSVGSVLGLLARTLLGETGPLTLGGLIVSIVSQLLAALVSTIFFVMLARLYAQRSAPHASVPSSGT
jgi:hypothetical protein